MAGLLGEGGQTALSGTWNSNTPATLLDLRPSAGNGFIGPDGYPCNIYSLNQNDTSSTYLLKVRVGGLQMNSTASAATIFPLTPQSFQLTEHANELDYIQGWLTTYDGANLTGADTANSVYVFGQVIGRRT